jgi:hypothetical protein
MLDVLEITHKYAMDRLEENIIRRIMKDSQTGEEYVEMILASRIVDSTELYEKAIERLARDGQPGLSWEQAKLLGFETYFEAMSRRLDQENKRRKF